MEGTWSVAVDGETTARFDGALVSSKLIWDDAASLHTVACRDGELRRVEIGLAKHDAGLSHADGEGAGD